MRILILGNNYSARKYYKYFSNNKENIVFSSDDKLQNCVEFLNIEDIVEFCKANEINFVLITDEIYINQGVQDLLSNLGISVFAPSIDSISICSSKIYAKKFMHKNKILTPKFQVFEKPQLALDYINEVKIPQAIKPDCNSYQECLQFCETQKQAQKILNDFFASGNKRVLLEDYIEGKNISIWALCDGYSAKIIFASAKYNNEIALFEPDFVDENLKERINQEIIQPTINALSSQGEEYIGILGFDCILTYKNEIYLVGYNSFYDDLNVDFSLEGFNINWLEVFDSTIVGDVFSRFEFKQNDEYMLAIRQNEKINLICAKTRNNLEKYMKELEFELEQYNQAKKVWKY